MRLLQVFGASRHLGPRRRSPASFSSPSSPRRHCATLAAQQIVPAAPILHSTIADAHIHASCLLAEFIHVRQPTSLAAYVQVTEEWWRTVEQLVLLPFAAEEIADLPQYLVECAGVRKRRATNASPSSSIFADGNGQLEQREEEEAALLEKWEEWVWSSEPRTVPTAAAAVAAAEAEAVDEGGDHASARTQREVLTYPQLTSLLASYTRYHHGVQWGAAAARHGAGGAAAAAYYRRRYFLHPWHGLSCPEGTAQQMPYVHLLRWMLAGVEGDALPAEELWRQHRALENFAIPVEAADVRVAAGGGGGTATGRGPFRALDVCSQSGYVTDLLLRAGADLVVAADADQQALGNTESTYHEHLREGRSARRDQVLLTRRSDGVPMPKKIDEDGDNHVARRLREAQRQDEEASQVERTSATAAERRRRRAREEGRSYSAVNVLEEGDRSAHASPSAVLRGGGGGDGGSPFHVVYIHPPAPSVVWPVTSAQPPTAPPLPQTSWWRSLLRKAAADGVSPQLIVPFLPCASGPSGPRRSPLATLSGLKGAVEALRSDVTERRATSLPRADASRGTDALLVDEGFAVLVLPRAYDPRTLLQAGEGEGEVEGEEVLSLADWVVAQLDGYYDLVLRRRCPVHSRGPNSDTLSSSSSSSSKSPSSAGGQLRAFEDALVSYVRRATSSDEAADSGEKMAVMPSSSVSSRASQWKEQLAGFYEREMWQDVLVFKKNPAMLRRCAAAQQDMQPQVLKQRLAMLRQRSHNNGANAPAVAWEDSFEYNEYHPRDAAAHTSHHWTDLMPTYSYLEPDFYDSAAVQRNFLAVGHAPTASAGYGVPSFDSDGSITPSVAEDKNGISGGVNGVTAASAQAAANFHTLFAQELRTRRRSKLRKLALSPLERQEWYIDEKLIKSSGARVDLMNELSKWDLKDYDR